MGVGQPLSTALAALGAEHSAAVVLEDGRATALVHRSRLDATG